MKNKLINRISHGIPIALYVISFLFTILLEIVNAQLDLNVMISIDFWIKLAMKYTILVIVLAIMLPYFDSKFKEEKVYQEIKNKFDSPVAKEIFNHERIIKLLEDHKSGKKDCYKKVWTIYTFLVWYDQFFA